MWVCRPPELGASSSLRDSAFLCQSHSLCKAQYRWDGLGTGLLVLGSEHVSPENRRLSSTHWKPWVAVQTGRLESRSDW